MVGPSSTVDQNILPVQAYFNLDGSFNTFIGQGQPFVVSATESIGIINTSVSGTFYPTFTAVNTGQVTTLSVTSSVYKFNPGTGELSAPFFDGFLNGTASEANNIAGGASSQLLYQTSANTTGFVPNGISGQFLVSNGTSAPSWSSVATSVTIVDQTSSSSTFYPLFYSATSGSTNTVETSSTKLQYVPSTGTFTSTVFSGSGASLTNIPNSALTNSSFTLGSTSISLGSTTTTIAGLTSVTSTTFVGALTGNASTATTATTATNATNIGITDNTSSIATWYPTIVSNTTGNLPATTSSTKLSFVPSTGTLNATSFVGSGASLTNVVNSLSASTGISVSAATGAVTVTNTAPDQTVVLTAGTGISTSGTYPNFTIANTSPSSGGTVTSVTGTAPVVSSGGNTPVISMAAATTSVNGYLTSTDWTTFNGKQATLVSGTNIKTVGGVSLLGSGDVGTIGVAYGGTGLTTLTANYIPYGNGTGALQSVAGFNFNGTSLTVSTGDSYFNTVRIGLGGGSIATNTCLGYLALNGTVTGASNVGLGSSALRNLNSGTQNTAIGASALYGTTGGSQNTSVGSNSLNTNSSGSFNSALGQNALLNSKTANYLSAVGYQALNNHFSGDNSVAYGANSLYTNTSASSLTAIGTSALYNNTTNVATLGTITGGTLYTTGTYTGVVMTLLSGATAITYPTATIVVSGGAVTSVTLTSNGVGLRDTTTVLTAPTASIGGTGSGFSVPVATLNSATGNCGGGYQVLYANIIGQNLTAWGYQAGYGNASVNANTIGKNNTYLGYQTIGSANNNTNEMVIGYQAVGLGSNTTVIGNSSTTLTKVFGAIQTTTYTVATLPSASTSGVGARAFVTDALAPSFGVTVTGGGAIASPVYSSGSVWVVG